MSQSTSHIIIDIPEERLDYNADPWPGNIKEQLSLIQNDVKSGSRFTNGSFFLFFLKFGSFLFSESAQKEITNVSRFFEKALSLPSIGGGHTAGYSFFEDCLLHNDRFSAGGITFRRENRAVYTAATAELAPILAAIRTKPFILLAGISGTGKSRMVRQLARGCCPRHKSGSTTEDHPLYNEQKPGNFEMIPVRPNWHDSSQLLGYESRVSGKAEFVVKPFVRFLCKAWLYEEEGIPFFLCLDEMNLAPVEQYFAEYLSVIESRKAVDGEIVTDPLVTFPNEALLREAFKDIYHGVEHDKAEKLIQKFIDEGGISIPQNFIVMGTVNMDETTFSFSRKVLDRAMSFELNEVDMDNGLDKNPDIDFGTIGTEAATCAFTQGHEVYAVAKDNCDKIKGFLVDVNKVLDQTPFKIAYRTRNEIMIYCHERAKDGIPLAQALDEAASMKILSRVEGDKRRLVVRDKTLAAYDGKGLLESLLDAILGGLKAMRGGEADYTESAVCSTKLKEMIGQLENGYTSFWTR